MSSSHEPIYWGTATILINTQTGAGVDYSLTFPPGTTDWQVTNLTPAGTATDRAFLGETLAQAQAATCPLQLLPLNAAPRFWELMFAKVDSGSGVFISGTAAATAGATVNLVLSIGWHRVGRVPDGMSAGAVALTAL